VELRGVMDYKIENLPYRGQVKLTLNMVVEYPVDEGEKA